MFSRFARWMSRCVGGTHAFILALFIIIVWLSTGPFFHFSDAWQLVVNTATTIVTFLMVFLLQNTQNRDTIAIQLKLDEIIRAMRNTHNALLKVEELSDQELNHLLRRYENLAKEIKIHIQRGEEDRGIPDLPFDEEDK